MTAIVFEVPITYWACPSCGQRDQTQEPGVHTRWCNPCPARGGMAMPMITRDSADAVITARHVLNERQDYETDVTMGPVMSVNTEYADGHSDCLVFAPRASVAVEKGI